MVTSEEKKVTTSMEEVRRHIHEALEEFAEEYRTPIDKKDRAKEFIKLCNKDDFQLRRYSICITCYKYRVWLRQRYGSVNFVEVEQKFTFLAVMRQYAVVLEDAKFFAGDSFDELNDLQQEVSNLKELCTEIIESSDRQLCEEHVNAYLISDEFNKLLYSFDVAAIVP